MEVFEDIGALYCECFNNNKDDILIVWFNWFKMYLIELILIYFLLCNNATWISDK